MKKYTDYSKLNNSIKARLEEANKKLATATAGIDKASTDYENAEKAKAEALTGSELEAYQTACADFTKAENSLKFFKSQMDIAESSKKEILNDEPIEFYKVTEKASLVAREQVKTALRTISEAVDTLKKEVCEEVNSLNALGLKLNYAMLFNNCGEYDRLVRFYNHIKAHEADFCALTGYSLDVKTHDVIH